MNMANHKLDPMEKHQLNPHFECLKQVEQLRSPPNYLLCLMNANQQKPMDQDSSTEFTVGPEIKKLPHRLEFGCLMGIPARAQWANDHAIAYLWAKMDP